MQATTAVAITVLVMIVARSFWLYAQRRRNGRSQGMPIGDGSTDSADVPLLSDTSTSDQPVSSTHNTDSVIGHPGSSSAASGSKSGGMDGGSD